MPSIIYPPTIDWHFLYQRPQQLLTALAKLGYKAFFCNASSSGLGCPRVNRLKTNLYLVSGSDPGPAAGTCPILWISYPPHVRLIDRYQPGLVVFDAVDEPAEEFAHWAADVETLRERAGVVFASSRSLYDSHAGKHAHVHLCPNGADYDHFAKASAGGSVPVDLASLPRPVIGYHGALANWLDWHLVREVAVANPKMSFVFIGPRFTGCEQLPTAPNLYYLGHRDYRILPSYLRGFDVCVVPFRLSPLTMACNPIKLWEYLAAGKPVVATPLPEVMQYQEVLTGSTVKEFSRCLQRAVDEDCPSSIIVRQALARSNSWDARARQIHRVLASTNLC